jgi:hypothetical protein
MEMIIRTDYAAGNQLIVTFRACPSCGVQHKLTVDEHEFENYMDGVKTLADAFPDLLPSERELFLTAIDGECYSQMSSEKE